MIRIVTDSASMITDGLRSACGATVVPTIVVIDGEQRREGVDLDVSDLFAALARGATVSTSAPSPGDFLACYDECTRDGATAIVSIHTGRAFSATAHSAELAARLASAPVSVVDTGTASFGVALAVRAAARALDRGATAPEAGAEARAVAALIGTTFVVGTPELAERGGRFAAVEELTETAVLATTADEMRTIARAATLSDAIEAMGLHIERVAADHAIAVAVGHADRRDAADRLAERVGALPGVAEILRYEVGPSVAAHTGPGTVGAVFAPVPG